MSDTTALTVELVVEEGVEVGAPVVFDGVCVGTVTFPVEVPVGRAVDNTLVPLIDAGCVVGRPRVEEAVELEGG